MVTGATESDIPTDPEEIKAHMKVRREAISILMSEMTMLSERLRHAIGPIAWLEYMTEVKNSHEDDFLGKVKEKSKSGGE